MTCERCQGAGLVPPYVGIPLAGKFYAVRDDLGKIWVRCPVCWGRGYVLTADPPPPASAPEEPR